MNNYGWDSDEVVAAKNRRIAELETDAIARTHDFFNLTEQHEKLIADASQGVKRIRELEAAVADVRFNTLKDSNHSD